MMQLWTRAISVAAAVYWSVAAVSAKGVLMSGIGPVCQDNVGGVVVGGGVEAEGMEVVVMVDTTFDKVGSSMSDAGEVMMVAMVEFV